MTCATDPPEILLTDQAYDALTAATEQARENDRETGGSLLCHQDETSLLVAYALPPGPAAQRHPAALRTDAAYQNAAIARVQAHLPGLAYAGDWHIHPMWLPALSATDREAARGILAAERQEKQDLLLLLGTARPGHGPVVLAFYGRLTPAGTLQIDEIPLRLVDSDGPEVRARLGQPLPDLDSVLAEPEPAAPVPTVHPAAERIRRDLAEARATLQAEGDLWVSDAGLFAKLRRGPCHALVLFPPDYPSGAPRVFAGTPAGYLEPIALPYAWSSAHALSDPLAIALTPPLRRVVRAARAAARLYLHHLRRAFFITQEENS